MRHPRRPTETFKSSLIFRPTTKSPSSDTRSDCYQGTELFNQKPASGIDFLMENGILPKPFCAEKVAEFLRTNYQLDKNKLGEYISNRKNTEPLRAFVMSFAFANTRIDEALRMYLESFRLPGEALPISLVLEQFAEHWHTSNNQPFASADATFTLAYAIIMLNVDQHNRVVKKQSNSMKEEDFIKNLKGVNGGSDFEEQLLSDIYHSIKNEEIIMPAEQTGLVKENYLWKALLKLSSRHLNNLRTHRRHLKLGKKLNLKPVLHRDYEKITSRFAEWRLLAADFRLRPGSFDDYFDYILQLLDLVIERRFSYHFHRFVISMCIDTALTALSCWLPLTSPKNSHLIFFTASIIFIAVLIIILEESKTIELSSHPLLDRLLESVQSYLLSEEALICDATEEAEVQIPPAGQSLEDLPVVEERFEATRTWLLTVLQRGSSVLFLSLYLVVYYQ
ncbi:uncharacterized protein LOC100909366 [Galendromus occidentalis]|uniref:Uncharacterized protein LOC100909366 n=1 Tax=Galendromus occidentalis TaxID=34638 RepID=A0AAJ6QUJ5_9ACAR|nr:uncharacterized protein LOC100909366 [Galendromus occidentalis]